MSRFLAHSATTDPGTFATAIRELPDDVPSLVEAVRNQFMHVDFAAIYELDNAAWQPESRETLPVAKRLQRILHRCSQPLSEPRPVRIREPATCRDYAVMVCSFLREKGIAARVRCGFATYFKPGRYEDHWICEYRDDVQSRWVRIDGQLDDRHREHLDISFCTLDLPTGAFLTSNEAWAGFRDYDRDPRFVGHGSDVGEWFLWLNLARDCLSLTGHERSEWDHWRSVANCAPQPDDASRHTCDLIARQVSLLEAEDLSVAKSFDAKPFWLTAR